MILQVCFRLLHSRLGAEALAFEMLASEWASTEEFIRFHQEVLVPLNTLLARYPAEQQAEVWRAIAEAARQFTTPDGSCRTENELLPAVGRREEDLIPGGKQ